jgi:membrane-anchored protein YejM (alkaline phosphatase superfamily)
MIYKPSFELALAFIFCSARVLVAPERLVEEIGVCISLTVLIKIVVVVKVYDWMQLFFNTNDYNLQI